ncbi:sporulation integral membrane protein YtvI [Natronospora cellulosivora (SeqCode)]
MKSFPIKLLYLTIMIIIIVLLLRFSLIYLTPFLLAIIFASIINPIVNRVENYFNINRKYAVLIVIICFAIMFVLIVFWIILQSYHELIYLWNDIPDYDSLLMNLNNLINENNNLQEIFESNIMNFLKENLGLNLQLIYNIMKENIAFLSSCFIDIITFLPMILLVIFLSFIATYFLLRDIDTINYHIINFFPSKIQKKVYNLEKEISISIIAFLRAQFILMLITAIISFLGLLIIGNNYALLIAVIIAVLDLIPILGPGLIFLPWIIFNILIGEFFIALKLLIIYTITAAFRQGFESKIIAYHLGFHPLAIMISFYLGYRIIGFTGFIIGPAVLILLRAIHNTDIFSDILIFKE